MPKRRTNILPNVCHARDGNVLDVSVPSEDTIELRQIDKYSIATMKSNGYINGTHLYGMLSKERGLREFSYPKWSESIQIRKFIDYLEYKYNIYPEIIYKKSNKYRGTYAHPIIGILMVMLLNVKFYVKVVAFYYENNFDAVNTAVKHTKLPPKQKDVSQEDIDSGLYLIELGTKDKLKHLYDLTKQPDNCKLYKYGKTERISARFKIHCNGEYNKSKGYTPKLVHKAPIPADYQAAAETELGKLFKLLGFKVAHDLNTEIIAVPEDKIKVVTKLMDGQSFGYQKV